MFDLAEAAFASVRAALKGAAPAAVLFALVLSFGGVEKAEALPSYARQTGQTCSTCHTAFPQLTPYGRRFKLGGYTAGGGAYEWPPYPPIAMMVQSTFTHFARGLDAPTGNYAAPMTGGFNDINNFTDLSQQISAFYGGRIWGNLGAFVQLTYSNDFGRSFGLDNTDIRYADTTTIGNVDVLYGLTVNNNPTVQDVWNTTPAWSSPFIGSNFALSPVASTMIEGFGPSQTLGAGAYTLLNDTYFIELTAYGSLTPRMQSTLGASQSGFAISGLAPYYRLAIEKNIGEHSMMVGAYGMLANIIPNGQYGFGTDKILDAGFDSQYQWITVNHAVTLRGNFIFERQKLDNSFAFGSAGNAYDYLRSLKLSAEYVYDHTYAVTGTYFQLTGSADSQVYANNMYTSPNSAGWVFDVAYLPFSKGAPGPWPWVNTRLGVSYTLFTRFDGGVSNIDPVQCPGCRNAKDNNTLLLYAFTAF
jgi:hypothetical protein